MKADSLAVEARENGVRVLRMNRPDKRNALDAAQWEILSTTVSELATDPAVTCLVLTGVGSSFASGGDLSRFLEEVEAPEGPHQFRERIRKCLDAFHRFPRPTVAMVNGPAIGGGLELAISCDVRIAARTASFGMPAVRFGIVMAYPDAQRLVSVVGPSWARFLSLTGSVIDAQRSYEIGLVHSIAEPHELEKATEAIVDQLLRGEPEAIGWFRHVFDTLDEPSSQKEPGLREFEERCLTTAAFRQRVIRFLNR